MRTPSPRWRGVVLLVAAALFIGGVVLSLDALDIRAADVTWWPLAVVLLVGTPATIVVNAAELRAMVTCLDPDRQMSWSRSIRVVVIATAANLLPLPGGAMVRIHALRGPGIGVGTATSMTALAAVLWVSTAVVLAGSAGLSTAPLVGLLGVLLGVVGVAVSLAATRGVAGAWRPRAMARLVAVEVTTTLIHAARLYLVLIAIAIAVTPSQVLVLGAGSPLAAAAGVFPSGLGLAELLSALLAPLVALPAAAGLTATALARVLGLLGTAPFAIALGIRDTVELPPDATAGGDPDDRHDEDDGGQDEAVDDGGRDDDR